MHRTIEKTLRNLLAEKASSLEEQLDMDVVSYLGNIEPGADWNLREAIEKKKDRRSGLAVILDTQGGSIESTEKMVAVLRQYYPTRVEFIIPNVAFSAGTILAMSGNEVWMSHLSALGPIDPQYFDNNLGGWISADAFLLQYERLCDESTSPGGLNPVDANLALQINLLQLETFQQIKEMAKELVETWLIRYKFRDWKTTATNGTIVTDEMRQTRAAEVAEILADSNKWHSHGRVLSPETLRDDVRVLVKNLDENPELDLTLRDYFEHLVAYKDYISAPIFVHGSDVYSLE